MVTIADLIKGRATEDNQDCGLVVSGQMSVREVLDRMDEPGHDRVGVEIENEKGLAILTKDDLLQGLLNELDQAGENLGNLQMQIDEEISTQLDMVKQCTRSMAESEKNFLEVGINYMTEGLIILGKDRQLKKCNPAAKKLFGLSGSETDEVFSSFLDDYGFREMFTENQDSRLENWGDFRIQSPTNAVLQIRWTEMTDECGDVIGSLAMLRDLTNEISGERTKTEFIEAITHELRTPLTIIQNSVSNILAGITGKINRKMRKYLKTIEGDCKRFGILVSDLLDVSKIEAGQIMLDRKVLYPEKAIYDAVCRHSKSADQKKIHLEFLNESHIPPVYADHGRIAQTLDNLISNAVKYTGQGGKVIVGCCEEADRIVIFVKDNGVGISEDHQKYVFDKFHQISRKAGAGYMGMGLGLAVSKGVIELHGGEIWLQSEESIGSKFFFSLPKMDPSYLINIHLEKLAKDSRLSGEEVAYISVKFENEDSANDEKTKVIGTAVKELLNKSEIFMDQKKDLLIQNTDLEVIYIISRAVEKRIEIVKSEIAKIISSLSKNKWNTPLIVPKIGVGIFPGDSTEIMEIENIARTTAAKLF